MERDSKEDRLSRAFVIGNGTILATGDRAAALHELYAPHLAPDHQLLRRPARIALVVDGVFRWLSEGFHSTAGHMGDAPIADFSLIAPDWGLEVWVESLVLSRLPLLARRIQVTNRGDRFRDARLLLHHDLRLAPGTPSTGEAALRDAASGGLIHHAGRRALLLNLDGPDGPGIVFAAAAARASEEAPGTAEEAAQGRIQGAAEASGIVDSVIGVPIPLAPGAAAMVTASIAAARTIPEARDVDAAFRRSGIAALTTRTRSYWNVWASHGARDRADLPEDVNALYTKSLVTLRLHQTPDGAILSGVEPPSGPAARPEYRWCWLRDASIAADALGRAGYPAATRRYLSFAGRAALEAGELVPVLDAAGSPAPAADRSRRALDGVALHLWAAARHFERERDAEFMAPLFLDVMAPAADRLAAALDARTGLPLSTDLWEERWGAHASVAAAVRGGLRGASRLAAFFGESARARSWIVAADLVSRAMVREFYRPDLGRFVRSAPREGDARAVDATLDASLLWLGLFDDLEPEDPRVRATVDAVKARLWVRTGVGGLARYERDALGSIGSDLAEVPGNPWIAATLWLAQHSIRSARSLQDLAGARILLLWAAARAEGAGCLPEQLHPYGGGTVSASPSLGAHAWFVATVADYVERARTLTRCERCGEPAPARRERRVAVDARPSLPGIVAHP
ncbi:MAG TPA: glycoside hydrolase family 15 protein [Candidatus Eisenbacteria bacterium]